MLSYFQFFDIYIDPNICTCVPSIVLVGTVSPFPPLLFFNQEIWVLHFQLFIRKNIWKMLGHKFFNLSFLLLFFFWILEWISLLHCKLPTVNYILKPDCQVLATYMVLTLGMNVRSLTCCGRRRKHKIQCRFSIHLFHTMTRKYLCMINALSKNSS